MPPASAWIVDDLPQTRAWLRAALTTAFGAVVVHEAGSLAAANHTRIEAGWPDIALIDLRLPDGHGVELIREFRKRKLWSVKWRWAGMVSGHGVRARGQGSMYGTSMPSRPARIAACASGLSRSKSERR